MISYSFGEIKLASILFIYFFIPLNPLIANEYKDFVRINGLVNKCYKNINYCKEALFKINKYQKHAARDKNFSCQTRFLGLEANLIMASNSNFKRKDAKMIVDDIKKYC